MSYELLGAFETHSVAEIRAILDAGFDVRSPIKGKSIVNSLTEMYARSDKFPDCLRLLLDRGAVLDDPRIAPVLLNDADALAAALRDDPSLIHHRTSMVSAFTPLAGASLLHVAAEFGNIKAVRVLLEWGADVEARASVDEYGLNGHTPIFHTVNSNDNRSAPLLRILLDAGARPDVRLPGITWGQGFEWETTCFDVTPISYAQLGLLPQMHRRDGDIYANIARLLEASGRDVPPLDNVPNRQRSSSLPTASSIWVRRVLSRSRDHRPSSMAILFTSANFPKGQG
jgi:ankyrin repeat protein